MEMKVTNLANASAVIYHGLRSLEHFQKKPINWVGFYIVNPQDANKLILGPFQGKVKQTEQRGEIRDYIYIKKARSVQQKEAGALVNEMKIKCPSSLNPVLFDRWHAQKLHLEKVYAVPALRPARPKSSRMCTSFPDTLRATLLPNLK